MANIIASGTTLATSAEFTLAVGDSTTLFITTAGAVTDPGRTDVALIQVKSAAATWTTVGALGRTQPGVVLAAAGTYRVQRAACPTPFGVDRI